MYLIIWEYRVKAARVADFEKLYGENGLWITLFQKGNGYLGTDLLHDLSDPDHYLTIDRWVSLTDYKSFLSIWKEEYEKLDAQCEDLTEQETSWGKWETIL